MEPVMNRRPDQLAPLIANATGNVRTNPRAGEYQDAEGRFIEGCPKCRGTGLWAGRAPCFKCKGRGKLKFSQPAEQRARNRLSARAVKERKQQQNVIEFKAAHPELYAWLEARKDRWNVAREVLADIPKYGDDLHQGRMDFLKRKMDEDAAREESFRIQRAENLARAPI